MRKLFTTLMISLLAFSGLQAQLTLEVSGYVTDSNQMAMNGESVYMKAVANGAIQHHGSVQTNPNGYYIDSFGAGGATQGTLYVWIVDCHFDTIMETRTWSPNHTVFNIDFTICPGNPSGGNCAAAFQYTQNTNTVSFLNFSTGNNLSYHWDFGDGHTSTQFQPSHTYNSAGGYVACLTVSNGSCSNTFCDSVVISAGGNCAAAFQYTVNGNTANFLNFSNGTNLAYHWDFGDGHTSNQFQPSHTYNALGNYLACLTVSTGTCSDTFCDSVVIDTSTWGGCHTAFNYGVQQQTAYFQNYSVGMSSYHWDFGDGHTSTAANPSHFYTSAGTYTVCLIGSNPGTTCSDTTCHVIQVNSANNFFSISGFVTTSGALADYATVYLIEMDSTPAGGISLTAIDTQHISGIQDSGYYSFVGLQQGDYLVKAALDPQSSQYANYMPTYYDTVLYWNQASTVVVGPNAYHVNIHMVPGNNPGGPGFIGGLVSQGANKTAGPGDPIAGASVLLLTDQDEAVTHAVTNQDGEFSFDNLAYGSYKVRVEIAGKTSQVFYATIDAQNGTIDDISFKVNEADITTGIWNKPVENILDVTMYPNPAGEYLSISLGGETDEAVDFRLVDISGRTVMSQPALLGPNQNQVTLSLDDVPTGTYMVELAVDGLPVYHTKLVRFK